MGNAILARPTYQQVLSLAAGTITASGQSAILPNPGCQWLELVTAITGAVSGAGATLNPAVAGVDPNGNTYFIAGYSSPFLQAPGTFAVGCGPGSANAFIVPDRIQLIWTVTGTTPSFGGVTFTLFGRS